MHDAHGATEPHRPSRPGGDTAEDWDASYGETDQRWSGHPNGPLPVETAHLVPGTALDVGCGEGADAIWLATQGWRVTGLDISEVALARGRRAARSANVDVAFVQGDIGDGDTPARLGRFDLVSVHYPAFRKAAGDPVERALLGAVAPGGTLLVVGHAITPEMAAERGFPLDEYVLPPDVTGHLDDGWTIETDETRPRVTPPGYAGPDVPDVILRARRT